MARTSTPGRRWLALSLSAALLAGCGNEQRSSDPPAGSAVPTDAPGSGDPSGHPSAPTASATPQARRVSKPTSVDLIEAAYRDGRLDLATSILYRLQAQVGDERLPEAYRGEPEEDVAAGLVASEAWDTLTEQERDALEPYLVRPTDPASIYAQPGVATAAGITLAATNALATICADGFANVGFEYHDKVWAQCDGDTLTPFTAARANAVAGYIRDLWQPMVEYMGPPIKDRSRDPSDGRLDDRIDIYVIDDGVDDLAGRRLRTKALATTYRDAPFENQRSSGYIVIGPDTPIGESLRAVVAHELFHVLEFAHNRGGGGASATENHWFTEASAAWAEYRFVPAARASFDYPRFSNDFQGTTRSLASTEESNEYASWVWPLFMQQEAGGSAVARAWQALEGKLGFDAWQEAISSIVSFETRFRDFAVRSYNGVLTPGDPIRPRFADVDGLAPEFPDTIPDEPRGRRGDPVEANGDHPGYAADLAPLWSSYTDLRIDPDVMQVEFDFSDLNPQSFLDVDLLVQPRGREWERRTADSGPFCDIERVIVVLSSHAMTDTGAIRGTWKVKGKSEACPRAAWRASLVGGNRGAGEYSGNGDVYCSRTAGGWSVTVVPDGSGLKALNFSDDPGSFYAITDTELDTPADWFWTSSFPGGSVRITVVQGDEPVQLVAVASWNDGLHQYDARVSVTCSPMVGVEE